MITKGNAKVIITPIDHFAGARFTRRTWRAAVAMRIDEAHQERCSHEHGHRTVESAKKCGLALWRGLR